LAGAPIADRPWTRKRRLLLWESRVGLTEQLLKWLGTREQKPALMISGSAVGWYGDSGEREIDETSLPAKEDFASQLCNAWEETAQRAEALGVRVVLIRTGLVLSDRAGFSAASVTPLSKFRHGRADRQCRQWIRGFTSRDQIAAIDFLLNLNEAKGPYNVLLRLFTVRNRQFFAKVPWPAFSCTDR
ncbi:NAD-dependent epimerase/dehydratase family protein, partial [Pseudomonas syringae]|uniref:NAD-dependent epimerase/dehydratase family protein n=1 Tax=Pseudomonas syringae TaxID=317 RepID=UPI0030C8D1D5